MVANLMSRVVRTMEPIVVVVRPWMDVRQAVSALAAPDTCIEEDAQMPHGLQKIVPSTVKKVYTSEH